MPPVKWQQTPWGDEGGGFWVVGLIGTNAIWYDDIEDGFQLASYKELGVLDEYRCSQDELHWVVGRLLRTLAGQGSMEGGRLGPPEPVPKAGPP